MEHRTLFVSPAPEPRKTWRLVHLLKSITRPIEGWPPEVFEQPVYRPPIRGMPLMLMDPAAIREMLVEKAAILPQGALWRRIIRPFWGHGIATSQGADWRWQRHAATPAFRPVDMKSFAPSVQAAADAALARWKSTQGEFVDIAEETTRITFDVVLDTMLGGGDGFDRASALEQVRAAMKQISTMPLSYFLAQDAFHAKRPSVPVPSLEALRTHVEHMIARRRSSPPRGDLIDRLMAAEDPETGAKMDDMTLRDNVMGFIAAGHETSAVALAWSIYLAAEHKETGERIRAEAIAVAGDGPILPDHVEDLVFTHQVIQEAMRLYPPGYLLSRVSTEDTEIAGEIVEAGSRVIIPVYALHRHRLYWKNPDAFDPDRFAPGKPTPDRHVYMPFGGGPRVCLGAAFAMMELVVALAALIRSADFELKPGWKVWPECGLALRPEGGLPMRISIRR